ncbi:DNA gyrase inhibitor YacG [Sphingomonas sp. PL-96]|uniref:DNA gyrase inhibitor YacG n=1 Tax=Sphingomonas sp. PL-96 TaxID=2887201 RepID=UPI001E2D635C|nr:DNA gyrase inhibitor YacG [Sphingomonas sp. PL-96]MCC2977923.1 DNA gyrase inhibitor YacG [Sphingomonas sp. PL-96]
MSKRASRDVCALCGAPVAAQHAPFCSQGCRDRDLLNWLGEGYRLPGTQAPAEQISHGGLDSDESAD